MKKCPKCGADCKENDTFCGNCGFQFANAQNRGTYTGTVNYSYNNTEIPRKNGLATASLVLGIVGLVFLCCYGVGSLAAILAIVFGCISRESIIRSGGKETGMSYSTAGLVMGIVAISILIVAIVFIVLFSFSLGGLLSSLNLPIPNGSQING